MKSGTFPPQRLFPTRSWFNNIKDGHYLPAKLLYVYRSKIEKIFACVRVAVLNATLGVTNDSTTDWITIYFPPCYWRIPRALSNPLCVEINGTNIERALFYHGRCSITNEWPKIKYWQIWRSWVANWFVSLGFFLLFLFGGGIFRQIIFFSIHLEISQTNPFSSALW